MASMVATAIDLRDEMDETAAPRIVSPMRNDAKAKLMIRTRPKECNPTPMATSTQPMDMQTSSAPVLLSPKTRKPSATADLSSDEPLDTSENPFDDITEEKLQKLTGKSDLARVTSLQLSVDARKQSVEVLGELLPSLQQLRIQPPSTLDSFRDLGTSLHALQILWVANCGIADLDGIGALTELQELHLQHNVVSDISPLTMHDELRVVDLESNQIADVGQVEQLAYCPQLTSLTLRGNPLCRIQQYRRIVATFLPQLELLDGKAITPDERVKLSDEVVDAAIQALKDALEAEAAETRPHSARPESSHGRRHDEATGGLLRMPSSARLDTPSAQDPSTRDDYSSTLTHGTDIVFAGNVTSALRRHRSETEGSGEAAFAGAAAATATGVVRYPVMERPSTPARESITATLDRANELEKHKSRDAILHELKAWRLEAAGSGNVGVVSMDDPTQIISPSVSPIKRPPNSSGQRVSTGERRPTTSAGAGRNGVNVREAFVETAPSTNTPAGKRRSSSSSSSVPSIAVPTLSSRNVDILILDEEPQHDDQLPCSPRKTSRGVFTTSTRAGGDWNLEEIAPKLDLESTASFLQRSSRRQLVGDEADHDAESASSDSDSEDMRKVARQLKQRKPTTKPPTHSTSQSKGFFNVAESLHAIDRWREQMDDDALATGETPTRGSVVRRKSPEHATGSSSPRATANDGVACRTADDTIVQWMKEKHTNVADIKTRDGFRRFFRGIDEPRLMRLLQRVFNDSEKVRRRLQLMHGFYSGQEN